jgi:hypothetical protein
VVNFEDNNKGLKPLFNTIPQTFTSALSLAVLDFSLMNLYEPSRFTNRGVYGMLYVCGSELDSTAVGEAALRTVMAVDVKHSKHVNAKPQRFALAAA